jgi:PAS domain S-box-containing protein
MSLSLPAKYSMIGAAIIPVMGRLALHGTGHSGDLYRYTVPLLVGGVAGFLLGRSRQRWLDKISELESTYKLLRSQEEKYRQIYNAPGETIIIYSPDDGKFLETNKAMEEMFGYSPNETSELTIDDISEGIYPFNREGAQKLIVKALTKQIHTFEWRSKKKNGEVFWTEISLKKARFHDRNYLIAVLRDIDQRKQIELELIDERERLRVTLRSIGDGVITSDVDGRVVLINKVAEQLTGWSHKEAVGRPVEEIFHIINEQSGKPCENPVRKVLKMGCIIGLANHTALVARNGARRSIADSGAPIRDRDGNIIGTVLVFRDVTEELAMERELLKTRKLESVGLLAGGIAHDFNNILMALTGNISLARARLSEDSKANDLLLQAEKAAHRATNLTRQLLTFSRGGKPIKEITSLEAVIRESADFILHGTSVTCSYDFDAHLWPVSIDQGQIGQVIQNLALNGCQAMRDGGMLEISAHNVTDIVRETPLNLPQGNYVKITVKDKGVGIDNENLENIFDPYFSTKKEGTGLGLAVCHSIISKHNGVITVASVPGKETVFTIYLPADPKAKVETAADEQPTAIGRGLVLVMDDDAMVREIALQMLEYLGYKGIVTRNGEETVDRYHQCLEEGIKVQAVILDLTIAGGMGGKDTAAAILKLDPSARLIVASGYSNDPVMAEQEKYGFTATMNKPFNIRKLARTLDRVINNKEKNSSAHPNRPGF